MIADGYKDTEIGVIPIEWDVVELETITTILLSNVDKKSKNNEENVKLCNYMDVYNNQYITNDLVYMEATAKDNQIEKFQLQINDVIITKDSETKDDIAIPAVVMETSENLLCGYHLAVLRPKKNILNGVYLMKAIQFVPVHKHFEKLANGITRFGLTSSAINQALVPLPPLKEQEKIADILSTADDKIGAIAIQIEKAETLKKGLLQKLLSEGIGHSVFKNSELGKIPESWEVVEVGKHTKLMGGYAFKSKDAKEFGTRWLKIANVGIKNIKWEQISYLEDVYQEEYKKFLLKENDVVLAMTRPILSMKLKIAKITNSDIPALLNQRVGKFIFDDNVNDEFMYQLFQHIDFVKLLMLKIMGTDPPNVSSEQLESIKIPLPPLEEQKQIADILSIADEKLEVLRAKKEKYETLKKGLLQKLLSGEVRV